MNHQEQSNSNPNSGLLRFRSAPSSLFSNSVINGDEKVNLINNRSLTHFDSENLFLDLEETKPNTNGFSLNSQLPPQYPKQSSSPTAMGTNLMRQSSSPAGLYSHITAQNGYAALRGIGNYRVGNGSINGGTSPSSCRLRSSLSFSSGLPSSLGMLSQISENENENFSGNCNENIKLGNRYLFGGAWNDSSHFPDNFSVFKRDLENDGKLFSSSQNGEIGNRTNILSHHLSLPKTSAEMAVMEKLLHFQDTVPCKVRAKRGCATHPRSIAERVRRTRISERMRKLQELVPNMDKQTNTAEMLDLAVEYIKELQKQYKVLSENRAKCKCSSTQKPLPNL